ncbi:unnamed protein product [Caenorhabditis sp. 36 PRJEB53466]|nr:unnamed protein product [Caenorhabditis sp. 36 PRJEB53466]
MTAAKNALKKLSKTQRTTYNVLSSKSGSSIEVSDADHSEHSYRAKVTRTKTVKTEIDRDAEVSVTCTKSDGTEGGKYNSKGVQVDNAPPKKMPSGM